MDFDAMRARGSVLLIAVAVALVAMACASTSFEGGVFRGHGGAFRVVPLPAAWRRVELPAADLAFHDDGHDASVLVNSRCGRTDLDAPLSALTAHLLMGTTDRQPLREETVAFDEREARHTVVSARLDGVRMEFDIYVLKKNGCVFDLVYVAPPTASADGAAAFEAFARGFHTLPNPG